MTQTVCIIAFTLLLLDTAHASGTATNETKLTLERAAQKHGIRNTGVFERADENRIALEIISRIARQTRAASTVNQIYFRGISGTEALEMFTSTTVTDESIRKKINKLFSDRATRKQEMRDRFCTLARNTALSDEEYLSATENLTEELQDESLDYQMLKTIVPTHTLEKLHEREKEFSHLMVERKNAAAMRAYTREVVHIIRPNHAEGCKRRLSALSAGEFVDG